uniref:Uncharacterized protein n=1 Tax=Setaria viridis TaxID=4556 RepID=A0A4U6U2Y7_SETVI|nr:hypothetical protein SEVIR_7G111200v2 [Setaria viridis]TKW04468.1 hypothetical protein SEVIR_7G111200v2 [Setaria viridis]
MHAWFLQADQVTHHALMVMEAKRLRGQQAAKRTCVPSARPGAGSLPGDGGLGDGLLDDEEPPEDPHEQHPRPRAAAAVPRPGGGPRRRPQHGRAPGARRGLRLRVRRRRRRRLRPRAGAAALHRQQPVVAAVAPGAAARPAPRPRPRQLAQLLVEVLPQLVHPVLYLRGLRRRGISSRSRSRALLRQPRLLIFRHDDAGGPARRLRRRRRRGRRGGRHEAEERELAARRQRRRRA